MVSLCALSLIPLLLSIDARSVAPSKERSQAVVGSARMGMLSRLEPLISNMVVPFLVATGVVSLVRMVPSVVSQIPNVFGFAKRHGYSELPREVLELMQMLDGANVKYDLVSFIRQQLSPPYNKMQRCSVMHKRDPKCHHFQVF